MFKETFQGKQKTSCSWSRIMKYKDENLLARGCGDRHHLTGSPGWRPGERLRLELWDGSWGSPVKGDWAGAQSTSSDEMMRWSGTLNTKRSGTRGGISKTTRRNVFPMLGQSWASGCGQTWYHRPNTEKETRKGWRLKNKLILPLFQKHVKIEFRVK